MHIDDRPLQATKTLMDLAIRYRTLRWSPDGAWLAMIRLDSPGVDLLHVASRITRTIDAESYLLDASFSPDSREILIPQRSHNGWSLQAISLADGKRRTIVEGLSRVRQPVWAADGTIVVAVTSPFSKTGELLLIRPDGARQRLALAALSYDLSPDGRTLAYTPPVDSLDDGAVRLADATTGTDLGALSLPGERLWNARWSPDGQRLVASDAQGELVIISADGSSRLRLGPGDGPVWSPDGRFLAYHGVAAGGERIGYGIFAVAADGSGSRMRLAASADPDVAYIQPAWSPENRIAYLDYDHGRVFTGEAPWDKRSPSHTPGSPPAWFLDSASLNVTAPVPSRRVGFPHVPILIDPGHGGMDYGVAPGASEQHEKDLVLQISLLIVDELRKAGVPVAITRSSDRHVSVSQRISFANALFYTPDNSPNAGRLLSIHLNSNLLHPNLSRVEVRVPFNRPEAWPLGLALYQRIREVTGGHYGFVEDGHPAGVHPADLGVTSRTFPMGFNILTESLFLSNPDQAAQVADPIFQRRLAHAHVLALKDALHQE